MVRQQRVRKNLLKLLEEKKIGYKTTANTSTVINAIGQSTEGKRNIKPDHFTR